MLEKLIQDLERSLFNRSIIYIELDSVVEREDILNITADMFLYLNHCPSKYEIATISFISNLLQYQSVRGIVLNLNQLMTIFEDDPKVYKLERNITRIILDRLTNLLQLEHKAIKLMTSTNTLIRESPTLRHYYKSILQNNNNSKTTDIDKILDYYGNIPSIYCRMFMPLYV